MANEARMHDPEQWTDADTAPVPSKIFKSGALLIDAEIDARIENGRPRVRADLVGASKHFARRSLEVAILSAVGATQTYPSRIEWEGSWLDIRDDADKAHKALALLLKRIDPRGSGARRLVPVLRQSRLGRTMMDRKAMTARSRRDALILRSAAQLLKLLADDTDRRRLEMIQANKTVVAHDRHEFVFILYEAWIFLTGIRPGQNPDIGRNPFLRFVNAAWRDWQGNNASWLDEDTEISFVQSMNLSRKRLTDSEVDSIKRQGPLWK